MVFILFNIFEFCTFLKWFYNLKIASSIDSWETSIFLLITFSVLCTENAGFQFYLLISIKLFLINKQSVWTQRTVKVARDAKGNIAWFLSVLLETKIFAEWQAEDRTEAVNTPLAETGQECGESVWRWRDQGQGWCHCGHEGEVAPAEREGEGTWR